MIQIYCRSTFYLSTSHIIIFFRSQNFVKYNNQQKFLFFFIFENKFLEYL